jgi:hypothetical protein
MQKLDWKQTMLDVDAAWRRRRRRQGRHRRLLLGRHGRLGGCGAHAGLAASVPYYGGGMPNFKDEKPKIP